MKTTRLPDEPGPLGSGRQGLHAGGEDSDERQTVAKTTPSFGPAPGERAASISAAANFLTDLLHTKTASRFSLDRGAADATPCKASVGGGVGGPRADRGCCRAPAAGAAAPRPIVDTSQDFPPPPLRSADLHSTTTYLRPAPRASAGTTSRGVPARGSREAGRPLATQTTTSGREAGAKEENNR
jgi:hypothetical protein